jgi:hypothetical protein
MKLQEDITAFHQRGGMLSDWPGYYDEPEEDDEGKEYWVREQVATIADFSSRMPGFMQLPKGYMFKPAATLITCGLPDKLLTEPNNVQRYFAVMREAGNRYGLTEEQLSVLSAGFCGFGDSSTVQSEHYSQLGKELREWTAQRFGFLVGGVSPEYFPPETSHA